MHSLTSHRALRSSIDKQKHLGKRIGFVPTMGNLHAGHIALIHCARQHCDWVIASIFVNPLQFSMNEDLDRYPRTLSEDKIQLEAAGCDALFLPELKDIYPKGLMQTTKVCVPQITQRLCGASRPGHFDGVTTVVSKLFNLVTPDMAFFGEKDFQQLATIRKMVADLNYPIEIVSVPTTRAEDSLALSSRNGYLSHTERSIAPQLYRSLQNCKQLILAGEKDYTALEQNAIKELKNTGLAVDYFEICNTQTLEPAQAEERELTILVAASLGNTRLIDNVTLILNCVGK